MITTKQAIRIRAKGLRLPLDVPYEDARVGALAVQLDVLARQIDRIDEAILEIAKERS